MSLYAIDEREAVAQMHIHLATRRYHAHTTEQMLAQIPQHPAATIGSAVDDCRGEPCPYCCAAPFEGCRPDCSSYFEEGTS